MIDFILAGLTAGLFTFFALFVVSFVVLGVVTGFIHLVAVVFRSLFIGKSRPYQEQTA